MSALQLLSPKDCDLGDKKYRGRRDETVLGGTQLRLSEVGREQKETRLKNAH